MRTSAWLAIVLLFLTGELGGVGDQTLTTLYQFGGVASNGLSPNPLVQGTDGSFYGTTYDGGASTNCPNGCGTIFKISPSGVLTTLYSFSQSDGGHPNAGLVQGTDGCFYGTTLHALGTVFKVTASGCLTNLHIFMSLDGNGPYAGLIQASDGNFYGTTKFGGMNRLGNVFRISSSGDFSNLYSFSGSDGQFPVGGLIQGSDGNLYGTTVEGGNTNLYSGSGEGTVFRISLSGVLTNLHFFNGWDGRFPWSGLIQATDGCFYGTTSDEGSSDGVLYGTGTVFRISTSGTLTTLVTFTGANGAQPMFAPLLQGSDGNLYGTTQLGGTSGHGTVFRISPNGNFTNLYSFIGPSDGSRPFAGLVQGSDGNFYGTTGFGGNTNVNGGLGWGTVFRISVPLNPPANQISAVQTADNDVTVSIPSVAGETYQLQFTPDLSSGTWSNIDGAVVSNSIGAMLAVTNFGGASAPQGFYRFNITP
ncbi:MAG TPA: choice-of-anchor tandem repeat GloVer-containing protein [Verrucomicrobiae bacterium]|nr:choice-of-anchor tandem repeat GloVer-containing protein [Verrucomicrobiae bacterium]